MKQKLITSMMAIALLSGCNATSESITASVTNVVRSTGEVLGDAVDAVTGSNGDQELSVNPVNIREQLNINPVFVNYDPLLGAYATSMLSILIAQEIWLKAIGKAELAAELEAQRKELETGKDLSNDNFKKIAKLSEQTQKIIEETQAEEKQLSKENGALFVTGFVPYSVGVIQARNVVRIYPEYTDSLKNNIANVEQMGANMIKSQALYYVGASGPDLLNTLYKTTELVFQYAEDQNLEVPSEAQQVKDIAEIEL